MICSQIKQQSQPNQKNQIEGLPVSKLSKAKRCNPTQANKQEENEYKAKKIPRKGFAI